MIDRFDSIKYISGLIFLIFSFRFVFRLLKTQIYITKCLENIPLLPQKFLVGNALDFLDNAGMLKVLNEYAEKYGTIVRGKFLYKYGLLITDQMFMKKFLLSNSNLSKGYIYDMTKPWLGEGLLTSSEDKWRPQRKMLMPAFSSKLLMDFIKIFDQQSSILIENIRRDVPTESADLHTLVSRCSLDIICETTMGISMNTQTNQNAEYNDCVKKLCKIISNRTTSPWKALDFLFIFSSDYRLQQKCLKIIRAHTKKIMYDRRQLRKEITHNVDSFDEFGRKSKIALLDILLDYSDSDNLLSDEEIADQIHTFMFAGHDTATATIQFMIYELAKHPELQEMAYQEQQNLFGAGISKDLEFSDIQEMKFLEMVVKETLRLYPPVPIIARLVEEEFKYENFIIPKDVVIVFLFYALHRNPQYFSNPDVFDPYRFQNPETSNSFSFLPFSTGPRNCIGQKFAMYEMKVLMSKLIRNFKFVPAVPEHSLELRAEVVLTSKNGIKVGILPRN